MSNLPNTLRMYAEDMHSAIGHSDCSSAMSLAADLLEEQKGTIAALNIALGGADSTSTENLIDAHEFDIADVGLIAVCRKLIAEISELEASPLSEEALDILRSKNKSLEQERDTLAAQNEALLEALESAHDEMLGYDIQNGTDAFGDECRSAESLLSLPNLAAEVLKRRDAETLRRAAEKIASQIRVKLNGYYGSDLEGHWFYLVPADEYAEAAIRARNEGGRMMDAQNKRVLDPCCGSRMMWFDRMNPDVVFGDMRTETITVTDNSRGNKSGQRVIRIEPDTTLDFRDLPYQDETFRLVAFDPPHLVQAGPRSWLAAKYGKLSDNWRDDIRQGFLECFRVLARDGVLVFKWNDTQIKLSEVLALTPHAPLFGHTSGKKMGTHWLVFMKPNAN